MLDLKALLAKILDALKADYIVEQGTEGIWTYRKWNSGRYEAWYEGNMNVGTGSAMGGGYFHTSSSALTPPTFSTSVTSMTGASNGQISLAYVGHNVTTYQTYWWNGASAAANNVAVRLDMYGRWGGVIESIKRFFTTLSSPKDWGWAMC